MINIFESIDKFFISLKGFDINYNICFLTFVGLFLFTIICVTIATSKSYEVKLTKAVDKLNNYFMQNPKITEENLLAFNDKMKSKKVPKQLRKQWQQYVLYRENKASTYMSFENCVTNPSKNSSFKRSVNVLNILAYVFSIAAFLLNLYVSYESNFITILQKSLVAPAFILILNFIVSMFLNFRHNAITSDLYTNYQYFEVNIDKATKTLPEYVDYEVLFDKNEIKRGIPILYTYLQKRAEDEQRELELARLKNVEHEKFNFDESGIAASLVLERAMQEAENYIAERKKYNQDTEQINTDITQEEMNYREITKEYNRQMQVSKETFANFKSQLEEASSTIEANYIKKQQQQELDRQRNLERDFDTATERHKKIIESYQAELDSVDKFRAQSRKVLEDAMMSEFETYSSKVYDEAKKIVEEREQEKYNKIKQQVKDLEEKLVSKEKELENVYETNQSLNEKLEEFDAIIEQKQDKKQRKNSKPETVAPQVQPVEIPKVQPYTDEEPEEDEGLMYQFKEEEPSNEDNLQATENEEFNAEDTEPQNLEIPKITPQFSDSYDEPEYVKEDYDADFQEFENYEDEVESSETGDVNEEAWEEFDSAEEFEGDEQLDDAWEDYEEGEQPIDEWEEYEDAELPEENNLVEENETNETEEDNINISTNQSESEMSGVTKRKAGRPRKEKSTEDNKPKRGRGRPKKEGTDTKPVVKKGRGRPKKVADTKKEETTAVKKGRGRPKKVQTTETIKAVAKKGRGRPKKEATETKPVVKKGRGRPKKVQASESAKAVVKKGRGRPKKANVSEQFKNIEDIDAYLKEIDTVIAEENAKFEASKKALEKKANLKTKK